MDLHKLQVEITAKIEDFKKKCDAVKKEAKQTWVEANGELSKIGNSKTGKGITDQYKQVQKETKNICEKIKNFSKTAQIDAGILVPTKEYQALEKNIASAEKRLSSLQEKQRAMPDKDAKKMTDDYAFYADKIKSVETRLDSLIEKQIQWADIGVDPNAASFKELDAEIEDANAELDRYKKKQEELEKSGKAFLRTEKWKALQREVMVSREELRKYRAEEKQMAEKSTDYKSTIKPQKPQKQQSPDTQLIKAYSAAGKKYLGGIVSEAAKVHPKIKKLTVLMQKFGDMSTKAGNKGKAALNAINTAAKVASWPVRTLASGFGKVYQKMKEGISVLKRFTSGTNSLSNSCGKLMGKMGALRITATYMLASFMIMGGINAMKEGFKSLSQYSSRTNADLSMLLSSLTQLRNSLATAFAPILSVVAPILSTFIDWISAALTAVAHFMAAITGKSQVVVSRKANQDFAGSIADTGSAADGAANSVEKYKRSLMGFDKINKLDAPDTGSGSGGGSGASGGVGASDMFETVEVGSSFVDWADQFKQAWENADFTQIGVIVGEKLNNALENIPWEQIKVTSGKIADSIATFLNGFIKGTNWTLVGKTFAEGVNTIIEFGYEFVTTYDWKSFGEAIGKTVEGLFAIVDFSKAGQALGEGVKGIFDTISTALGEVDWKAIGKQIGNFLINIDWLGVLASVGKAIANAIIASLDLAAGLFESVCEGIRNMSWSDLAKTMWELIKSAWQTLKKVLEVGVSLIKSGWSTIVDFVGDVVKVSISLLKKGWNVIGDFVGTAVSVAISLGKSGWKSIAGFIGNAVKIGISLGKSGWKSIKTWLGISNAFKLKFKLPKIKVKWSTKKVAGFKIKYPSSFSTYAQGGFPEEGPFLMNRGEIAGKFSNGKSVVANNQQITTGIAKAVGPAVYEAVLAAMSVKGDGNGNVTIVLEGDAKGMFKAVRKEAQNYTKATGLSAFPV